jgi:hypothetical protein
MATETTTTQATDEKVTFTPEQQARIDEIVREAMGRSGRAKTQEAEAKVTELSTKVTTLEQELADAKQAVKTAKTPVDKQAAKDELEAVQAQMAEVKAASELTRQQLERANKVAADKDIEIAKARGEVSDVRKQNAIQASASKFGFVDSNAIAKLTGDAVKFDEALGRFTVTGENGSEKLNSEYKPMTLDEFYNDYAAKNPWTVRSDFKSGAGSSQSGKTGLVGSKFEITEIFGSKSNSQKANKLAMDDPKEYHRLKLEARAAGIIA